MNQNTKHRVFNRTDMVFWHGLSDWLSFNIDRDWINENVKWREFDTGVRLGTLAREDALSLVLYDVVSDVDIDAFMPHSHPCLLYTSDAADE